MSTKDNYKLVHLKILLSLNCSNLPKQSILFELILHSQSYKWVHINKLHSKMLPKVKSVRIIRAYPIYVFSTILPKPILGLFLPWLVLPVCTWPITKLNEQAPSLFLFFAKAGAIVTCNLVECVPSSISLARTWHFRVKF